MAVENSMTLGSCPAVGRFVKERNRSELRSGAIDEIIRADKPAPPTATSAVTTLASWQLCRRVRLRTLEDVQQALHRYGGSYIAGRER